jgi:glucosamine-6-phosphate deaminase
VIRREVTERLCLDPAKVSVPDGGAEDPDQAAAGYDSAIKSASRIDGQILGIRHNGHIAFNEPGSALNSRIRVEAPYRTRMARLDISAPGKKCRGGVSPRGWQPSLRRVSC